MSSVAQYTRYVLLGKNFLWILSAGIITLVIWIASNNNADNGGRMVFTNVPKSAELDSIMQKPRYQGVDVHNRPYTVEADSALQQDKDTVVLDNVSADMINDNNSWVALKSGSGILNTATKQMELLKGVEVFYEGGYQFRTDHAHVDIAKGTVTGDSNIEGNGVAGTIQSKRFSIEERGNIINFNDSVRMLLYQNKMPAKKAAMRKPTASVKKPVSNSSTKKPPAKAVVKKPEVKKTAPKAVNKKKVSDSKVKNSKTSKTKAATKPKATTKDKNSKTAKSTEKKKQ